MYKIFYFIENYCFMCLYCGLLFIFLKFIFLYKCFFRFMMLFWFFDEKIDLKVVVLFGFYFNLVLFDLFGIFVMIVEKFIVVF